MPTKAELIKFIKDYKKKNCPPYSKLTKAELQKVAREMGYGKEPEKEKEVKIRGGDVLERIRQLREESKSRMQKRTEEDSKKTPVSITKFFGTEKKQSKRPRQPKPSQPKKSTEELINELKQKYKELFAEMKKNSDTISNLPEGEVKEAQKILKKNQKIREDMKKIRDKISQFLKKIKAQKK